MTFAGIQRISSSSTKRSAALVRNSRTWLPARIGIGGKMGRAPWAPRAQDGSTPVGSPDPPRMGYPVVIGRLGGAPDDIQGLGATIIAMYLNALEFLEEERELWRPSRRSTR